MASFGENLGISFQVLDDILDVTSTEDLLGKKAGSDLLERKPSLINVLWLESGSSLALHLKTPPTSPEDPSEIEFVAKALTEIKSSDVVITAKNIARGYAEKASKALQESISSMNNSTINTSTVDLSAVFKLQALIEYTLSRME